MKRWTVVHAGGRDGYQLPIAFAEVGRLERFITDWYTPLDRPAVGAVVRHLSGRAAEKLRARFHPGLPSGLVADLKLATANIWRTDGTAHEIGVQRQLGDCARRWAESTDTAILSTSYYGWRAFAGPRRRSRGRVLFQIHPDPVYLRRLYGEIRTAQTPGYEGLNVELEVRAPGDYFKEWSREASDADAVIVASAFTKRTLVESGVRPETIHLVHYGVDRCAFHEDEGCVRTHPRLLFVGQPTMRKGFSLLMASWRKVQRRGATLTVAGRSRIWLEDEWNVSWLPDLSREQLAEEMRRSDLLVLPSIAEGFGHVIVEALASGTPVLATSSSVGPDIITNGVNGYIIDPGNEDQLIDALQQAIDNVGRIRGMRKAAAASVNGWTWESFREGVRTVCDEYH